MGVNYSKTNRNYSWTVDAGFGYQTYNWYGLPQSFFDPATTLAFDVSHSFYDANFGGVLKFDDSFIKEGSVRFRRFGDDQSSGENRFVAKATVDIPIQNENIETEFTIDYLGGSFDRNYLTNTELKYGNFKIGLAPSYQLIQDDLTVNLGANLVYLNDTEAGENKFYIYPNITASYRLVDEILIAYGGVTGDLIQNSYYDFAKENSFVSPTLLITPTDQQYNGFVGLKGKLSNSMSYNINGHYYSEKNKALYISNTVLISPSESYQYGNSFGIVYDDVTTVSIAGELNVDLNRNFTLGIKAEYFNYSIDTQPEAWNLPDIRGSLFLDYQIDKHWFAGASLFYVGERKGLLSIDDFFITPPTITKLDSYFDANAHIGYKINDRLSVYAKANNIANQDYERWQSYPVQSIQFLAGATYQFDF